jgi:hypothetical protein
VLAVIAVGVYLPPAAVRAALVLAILTAAVLWVVGEALGGILVAGATDPNSGPLLMLLALAYWPVGAAAARPAILGLVDRDGAAGRDDREIPLAGGNVSASVVRVGATVRKPASPSSAAVEALLEHLASVGFDGAPRALGRDERGRVVLEFVPGTLADAMPAMTERELRRVGRLIRDYHDAVADFAGPADAAWQVLIPADREDLNCHHDLAPWNLVREVRDDGSERWVFIDWDGAGPGSRLWDLAYAAHGFVPLAPDRDPAAAAPRLRAFADGYDLDERQRSALPELIAGHTRGMYEVLRRGAQTGEQPWARLWGEGHGDYWGAAASYIERHIETWRTALLA